MLDGYGPAAARIRRTGVVPVRVRILAISVAGPLLLGLVGLGGPSAAWGAKPPRPVISSFTASADDPGFEALPSSPLTLYSEGGFISLQGTVSGGTECDMTSNRPIAGLPYLVPCSSSTSTTVILPPDTGKRPVVYRFKLRLSGRGTTRSGPVAVTVSSMPNPDPPSEVVPGSTWVFIAQPGDNCGDPGMTITETFNADLTVSGFLPGIYSIGPGTLVMGLNSGDAADPTYSYLTAYWDPVAHQYLGTDNAIDCTWVGIPA